MDACLRSTSPWRMRVIPTPVRLIGTPNSESGPATNDRTFLGRRPWTSVRGWLIPCRRAEPAGQSGRAWSSIPKFPPDCHLVLDNASTHKTPGPVLRSGAGDGDLYVAWPIDEMRDCWIAGPLFCTALGMGGR